MENEQSSRNELTEFVPYNFNFFGKSKEQDYPLFFKHHPIQTTQDPIIEKIFYRKDGSQRTWLSYNEKENSLFCWLCLALSTESVSSIITGFISRKHIHQSIDEHEKSISHKNCADSFFLKQNNSNGAQLLFTNENSLRHREVTENRQIFE